MIRVKRPTAEPPTLKANRDKHLPVLELRIANSPASFDPEKLEGYEVARDALFSAQHHKCCYCERTPLKKYQAVEHYRPKSIYWWLTWTWSNLLFVCVTCNRSKWNSFPLLSGASLAPKQAAPGREHPAILNAADPDDDPLVHVIFRKEPRGWVPYPREGSHRGRWTIHHCGLDSTELLDLYNIHEQQIKGDLVRLQRALTAKQAAVIQAEWVEVGARWLSPSMPFTALSRDILDHHVPLALRKRYGLSLDLTPPWI